MNKEAIEAGRKAWFDLYSKHLDLIYVESIALEFPNVNPYGDEWENPPAKAFRKGFDEAARKDGYTYSDLDGEYREGGEFDIDEQTSESEQRESM